MSSNLISLTATQAVRMIHGGKLRPEALMDAYLDHITHRDPRRSSLHPIRPRQARAAVVICKTVTTEFFEPPTQPIMTPAITDKSDRLYRSRG